MCIGGPGRGIPWVSVCIDMRNRYVGSASSYVHGNFSERLGTETLLFFYDGFLKTNLGRLLEKELMGEVSQT